MEHLIVRTVSGLILLLIVVAGSWAGTWDYNDHADALKYKAEVTDDVTGTGYVMDYKKADTNNLSLWEYAHGSGSWDYADLLNSEQKTTHTSGYIYYIDYNTGQWVRKYPGASSTIIYTRQYDNVQSPTAFSYGTGWYAAHPVTYNSLLKDKTVGKSYQEAISMGRQVEYAHALKGDIAVDLNCTAPTATVAGKGLASMKIDDDVTDGTLSIGMLLARAIQPIKTSKTDPKTKKTTYSYKFADKGAWRNPLVEVDTYYVGSFQVQKTMKVEISKSAPSWMEDWLPCCSGGFFDVPSYNFDKEHGSQKGIFDCSCRNTSISTMQPKWNASLAQFPTDTYQYKP
jgi:hypothetical protein